jgi:hypothetical protein
VKYILLLLTLSFFLFGAGANAQELRDVQIEVSVTDGNPEAGPAAYTLTQGDQVTLRVATDRPLVAHLHGYDLELAAAPGDDGVLVFAAELAGRFPLTLHGYDGDHGSESALLYLDVYPR